MRINKIMSKRTQKKPMKPAKRILPIMLSLVLLIGAAAPTFAEGISSEKEEVIYINLTADGSVKDVYAVNIFGKGAVTDYGDYSSVEMLNTTDNITQNGDRVAFSTSADRVYYKGKMKSTVIPWNISIRYYIDGKEYSANDAAGKSGRLEIKFKVTKNESCGGSYFDDYALQAAFTLDTEKCLNITAADATVANVGSKKQMSYVILPGEGIDTSITADVKDFEMDAVSINGIPLSMNIEVDDKELTDKITELQDAIAAVDDGADELKDGTAQMRDETHGLDDNISDKIDEMIENITGAGSKNVSFVSEKNTNVKSVQFVIQTQAVKIDETKSADASVKEKLTFWQKILRLFGLY